MQKNPKKLDRIDVLFRLKIETNCLYSIKLFLCD